MSPSTARQLVLANLGLKQISWAAAEFGMRYARAEIERLKSTIVEQAMRLHLIEGKDGWD